MKFVDRKLRIVNTMNVAPLTKPPKVRVADCPWCNKVTPIDRKKRGEEVHISNCYHCFSIFHVNDSRLIDYEN